MAARAYMPTLFTAALAALAILSIGSCGPATRPEPEAPAEKIVSGRDATGELGADPDAGLSAEQKRKQQLAEIISRLPPEQRKALSRSMENLSRSRARAAARSARSARSAGGAGGGGGGGGREGGRKGPSPEAERLLKMLRSGKEISGVVEGRILDAATGKPVAGRVAVKDAFGMIADDVARGLGFWADGRFRVRVIAGPVSVQVTGGPRRTGWRGFVAVKPGGTARVEARLRPAQYLNFGPSGWIGCDLRYSVGRAGRVRTKANMALAALAARAEGLDAVFLVRPWRAQARSYLKSGRDVTPAALSARCRALSTSTTSIHWGYERTGAEPFGRVLGLGLTDWRRIDRYSTRLGYPNSLACGEIRRQGGVAIYTDLTVAEPIEMRRWPRDQWGSERAAYYKAAGIAYGRMASELPFDTVAGPLYDAVALSGSEADERVWFRLLNEGYRVTAVGGGGGGGGGEGGGGGGSLESGDPPRETTLLRVGDDRSERGILEAIRKGRAIVTTGPYVFISVGDVGPGGSVEITGGSHTARVAAFSAGMPGAPLARVDLIRNGKVVLTERASQGQSRLSMQLPFREDAAAWYVARVTDRRGAKAWTNPVYFVHRGGGGAKQPLRTRLSGTVVDSATGKPLAGTIRVYAPDGTVVEKREFEGGELALTVPASAGVHISSPGYEPQRRLIFFASGAGEQVKAIHTDRTGRRAAELERAATYARAREACASANIAVHLRRR